MHLTVPKYLTTIRRASLLFFFRLAIFSRRICTLMKLCGRVMTRYNVMCVQLPMHVHKLTFNTRGLQLLANVFQT